MLCCRHAGCYLLLIAHPSFCRVATGSADNNRPSCSAKLFSFAKQHKQDVLQMFSSTLCLLRTGFSKSIVNSIAFILHLFKNHLYIRVGLKHFRVICKTIILNQSNIQSRWCKYTLTRGSYLHTNHIQLEQIKSFSLITFISIVIHFQATSGTGILSGLFIIPSLLFSNPI